MDNEDSMEENTKKSDNTEEIWAVIPELEDRYLVSNFGNVKNIKRNKLLKPGIGAGGYLRVDLMVNKEKHKNFRVHTLVAMAFLGFKQYNGELTVDHIDWNKTNNHVDNLQLITLRDNSVRNSFRRKNKTSKYLGVHYCKQKKKYVAKIIKDGKKYYLGSFVNEDAAGKRYQEKELELYGKITQQI